MKANTRSKTAKARVRRAALALGLGIGAPALLMSGCKKGSPPTIIDPGNQVAVVGKNFTLNLFASDPDGDSINYSFSAESIPDISMHAQLGKAPDGHAVFTYTPIGGHEGTHIFDFVASDGTFESSLSITIDVRGASGSDSAPIFRAPIAGVVLMLTENVEEDCVQFDVVVEDQDSPEIELSLEAPVPAGAELSSSDNGLEGSFEWCPNRDQRQTFQHRVTLSADDNDNPPTFNDVPIVLRRSSGEECPGEAPAISHAPQDFDTILDLGISANVTDDLGLKAAPVIFYAYEDPTGPDGVDFGSLLVTDMSLESGDMRNGTWTGSIPNPTVEDVGSSAQVYYIIEVIDDDDVEGECDHRSDSPTDGVHTITVTNSGQGGAALCEACSFDVQCGDEADLCLTVSSSTACGQSCSDTDTCPAGYECPVDPASSVDGAAGRQCVPVSGICGEDPPDECEEDMFEPDDNMDQAIEAGPVTTNNSFPGRLCPGDDDWVYLSVSEATEVTVTLAGDNPPDMDLYLTDSMGLELANSRTGTSDEEVSAGCLPAGDYFAFAQIFPEDETLGGAYDISFDFDTAPCGDSPCCESQAGAGCEGEATIETCVCNEDSICCSSTWDAICVSIAINTCNLFCTPDMPAAGACCSANGTPGCEYDEVVQCVCDTDSNCCADDTWTSACVEGVDMFCGGC